MPVHIHNLFLDVTLGTSGGSPQAQLKPAGPANAPVAKALPPAVVKKGGRPLDDGLRRSMEAKLGSNFADVRVHVDSPLPAQLQAKAFAQGSDVHFAPGQFKPNSASGQGLLAHELAHVVQQRQGRVQAQRHGSSTLDHFERQANAVERMFTGGGPSSGSGLASSISSRHTASDSLAGTIHRKATGGGMIRRAGGVFKKLLGGGGGFSASAEGKGSLTINRLIVTWPEAAMRSGVVSRKPSAMEFARLRNSGGGSGPVPPGFAQSIDGSSGIPLTDKVRREMEALLGADLTGVRVHLDAPAQEAAQLVGAEAFTLGQDIFFAPNRFDPGTADGMGLIAHELTHVAQGLGGAPTLGGHQEGGRLFAPPELGSGFAVAGHDAFERQAEANELAVSRGYRHSGDAMSVPRASDIMSAPLGSPMFAMSPDTNGPPPTQPLDHGAVRQALEMIRSAGPMLGSAADIAIGFVPVVGDVYDLMCGILGKAIFTWESLDVWDRLLCFVGVIPIPFVSGALLRRGKNALKWLLSEQRALRILNDLTVRGLAFVRTNLSRLRGWLGKMGLGVSNAVGRVADGATKLGHGVRDRVGRMFRRKPPKPKARATHDLFEEMFERKLMNAAAKHGTDPQQLLEAAAKRARADMETILEEGMGGMRFKGGDVASALKKQEIEVHEWKIGEYNKRVAAGAPSGADADLINYGKVPLQAGGAAAIAGKNQVYLLGGSKVTNFVLSLFKGNIPHMHEMGHVLQYAYFHRLIKHLDVPMAPGDLKLLQVYLEKTQKGAMEGMAYLFGTPIPILGQAFRRKMVRNFMDVAEGNLLAHRYGRWKTHMTTAAAARQGVIAGGIFAAVPGVAAAKAIGGGALVAFLDRIGTMRKAAPGAPDLDQLRAELAHERNPERARVLRQAIAQLDRPGLPLEFSVRNRLEQYLGQPLDDVRLHSGMQAERLARNLGAEAVTLGGQVVMGAGSYQPDTPEGLGLLAHEATHVVQGRQGQTHDMGPAVHRRLEAEAHAVEHAVVKRARAVSRPAYRAPSEAPEFRREPVRPAPEQEAPTPAPKQAVPASLSHALAKAIDERPEMAQADQIERAMFAYAGEGTSRQEFLEDLRERIMDLMREEMEYAAERGAIG